MSNYVLSIIANNEEKFFKNLGNPDTNMGTITGHCELVADPNRRRVQDTSFHFSAYELCQLLSENAVRISELSIETIPEDIEAGYEKYTLSSVDNETVDFINKIEKESESKFLAVILNPNAMSVADKETYDVVIKSLVTGQNNIGGTEVYQEGVIVQVFAAGTMVGDINETVRYFNSDKVGLTETFLKPDGQEIANMFGGTVALLHHLKEQGLSGNIVGFVAATHTMDHEYIIPYEFTQIAPVELASIQEPVEPEVPETPKTLSQDRYRLFYGSKVLCLSDDGKNFYFEEERTAPSQYFLLSTVVAQCLKDVQFMYKYEIREYNLYDENKPVSSNEEVINTGNIVSEFVVEGFKANKVNLLFINAKHVVGEEFAFFGDSIFTRTNQPMNYTSNKFIDDVDFRVEIKNRVDMNHYEDAVGTYYNAQNDPNHDFYINRLFVAEPISETEYILSNILVNGKAEFNDTKEPDFSGKWSVGYYDQDRKVVYMDKAGQGYYLEVEDLLPEHEYLHQSFTEALVNVVKKSDVLKDVFLHDLYAKATYFFGEGEELNIQTLTVIKGLENQNGIKAALVEATKGGEHFTLSTKLLVWDTVSVQAITTNASIEVLNNEIKNDSNIVKSMASITTLTPTEVAQMVFQKYHSITNRVVVIDNDAYVVDLTLPGQEELREPAVTPEPEFKPYFLIGKKQDEAVLWGRYIGLNDGEGKIIKFGSDDKNYRYEDEDFHMTHIEILELLTTYIKDYPNMLVEYISSKETHHSYDGIEGLSNLLNDIEVQLEVFPVAIREVRDEAMDFNVFEVSTEGLQKPEFYILQNNVVLRNGVKFTDIMNNEENVGNLNKLKVNASGLPDVFKTAYYGGKDVVTHILWFEKDITYYYDFEYQEEPVEPEKPEVKPIKDRMFAIVNTESDSVYIPETTRFELIANVVNWTEEHEFKGFSYHASDSHASIQSVLIDLIKYNEFFKTHAVVLWNNDGYEFIPNTEEGKVVMDELAHFISSTFKACSLQNHICKSEINSQVLSLKYDEMEKDVKEINTIFGLDLNVSSRDKHGAFIIGNPYSLEDAAEEDTKLNKVMRILNRHSTNKVDVYSEMITDVPKTMTVAELKLALSRPYKVFLQFKGYTMWIDDYSKENLVSAILYLYHKYEVSTSEMLKILNEKHGSTAQ